MTRRRPTIGEDPLDALMPASAPRARRERPTPTPAATAPRRRGKQRFTVHIPADVIEAVKNAVVALSGPPTRLTVAQLAEIAFRHEIERLQNEHHKGKPFPQRAADLVGGRPVGS
jgi:hypothetical protein